MSFRKLAPLAFLVLLTPLTAYAGPSYTVTVVGPAGSTAAALNDLGVVVGETSAPAVEAIATRRGFVFDGYVITLGPTGGRSTALAINNSGTVVGFAGSVQSAIGAGFSDSPGGTMQTFSPFHGYYAEGTGINDAGQIAGWGDDTRTAHSFVLSNGTVTDLGSLGGTWSLAYAINNKAQVAGTSSLAGSSASHAYLYSNGTMNDLGTLGGGTSEAFAINDAGMVAGWSAIAGNSNRVDAFLYHDGVMTDIGSLGGDLTVAYGINNQGQVVGYGRSMDSAVQERGFLYSDGTMMDLNSLIEPTSGWTIARATDINNNGQIAAYGVRDGVLYAVRLDPASPVPEPAAALMLAGGLGLLGRRMRRRRQGQAG